MGVTTKFEKTSGDMSWQQRVSNKTLMLEKLITIMLTVYTVFIMFCIRVIFKLYVLSYTEKLIYN